MRGRMGGTANYPGAKNFALNAVIPSRVVGQVALSRNPKFKEGDFVWGFLGWELYSVARGGGDLRVIDPSLGPISHAITVIGMPGLTARVGILDIGKPKPGETAFISAASGAVGSVAGQIAKLEGCRVVGSAGSDRKVRHIVDVLGFDAAFNYKTVPSIGAALDEHCPNGIDIYFDNVGGAILEAALFNMAPFGRVVCCGAISQYDTTEMTSPRGIPGVIVFKRLKLQGFIVSDFADKDAEASRDLMAWTAEGKLKVVEDVLEGLERAPEGLIGLLHGDNIGKRMVRIGPDPD
jgi:hypothetical protein